MVGTAYFPDSRDTAGHVAANAEIQERMALYMGQGHHVLLGGDLNAHTGLNHDEHGLDRAGKLLMETLTKTGMVLLNAIDGLCAGGPTRVEVKEDRIERSTIDYVLCSPSLVDSVQSMTIHVTRMGSDHCPLIVRLAMKLDTPEPPTIREVWKVRDADFGDTWAGECRAGLARWLTDATRYIDALDAMAVDDTMMADVLEWSFQAAIDQVAAAVIGTKKVGMVPAQGMDGAIRLLTSQRAVAEDIMRVVIADTAASEGERTRARKQFLKASRAVQAGVARKREGAELDVFHDVEDHQGDSKLFWQKYKALQKRTTSNKSPPMVAQDAQGRTVTDPAHVLRVWRDFCAAISSSDLAGTKEEGIYDDDHRDTVEKHLGLLRRIKEHHDVLDAPFTEEEVWAAIRGLKLGKAAGTDGVLTDIIKHAAGAVGNSKLDEGNSSVVTAMTLLFNFMFEREVWPERWSEGVIFPLHKQDSRLDPSNYRPITLLSVMGKLFGSVVNSRLLSFSESVGSVSDEQGGFRPERGAPDQVMLWREILASRRERGLPTLACFVDVRKAYDTVWREGAYVRIHEGGVRGKLWRQLQAMHADTNRSVLHPVGRTQPFNVERGVPQGAVESPWVYSQFIDGLARALKTAGLGVWVAGVQVPLLMYADDMVFMASSVRELRHMMAIATTFAKKNRFQYNGKKSAVMVMNAKARLRAEAAREAWSLAGEAVKVKDEYVYLGTTSTTNEKDWSVHLRLAIDDSEKASAALLRVLRLDKGMRPRTAISLWKSLVRPKLEYASEVWNGQVPATLAKEAEAVQLRFIRGVVGLHDKGSGVSNESTRAEVGCESLQSRWDKLQLGYWRRIFSSPPDRLLRVVVGFRRDEWAAQGGRGLGSRGSMRHFERLLRASGMGEYWEDPVAAGKVRGPVWKKKADFAVDTAHDEDRAQRMARMPSCNTYVAMKGWGRNPKEYSFSSGEVDKLGQQVPERYLDDRRNLKGTRLKMLCRTGSLPLMVRVGREVKPKWPREMRTCLACNSGAVEDVHHFIMECPAHAKRRTALLDQVTRAAGRSAVDLDFGALPAGEQLLVILGKRVGDPRFEDKVDWQAKKFLTKCWNAREPVQAAINSQFGTQYGIYRTSSAA